MTTEIPEKFFKEDKDRVDKSSYSEVYKYIKNTTLITKAEYLELKLPLTTKRIMAQVRLVGRQEWAVRTGNGIVYRIDENIICAMSNRGVMETRKHILEECPQYAEFRTEFLKDKDWTVIISADKEGQVWELVGFIRNCMRLRAFCLEE